MAIDCNESYVDGSEACDGRVLVHLRDTDGTAYFERFDIEGGPATGTTSSTTGLASANNPGPYPQNYTDAEVDEPDNFQCFYIPYNVGTQTSDTLTIQTTDDNDNPIGDACELDFTVSASAACGTTGGTGACLTLAAQEVVLGSSISVNPAAINSSGAAPTSVQSETNPSSTTITALDPNIVIEGDVLGSNTFQMVFPNGDVCPLTVNIVEETTGGGDNCLECASNILVNVNNVNQTPGSTLEVQTQYSGNLSNDVFVAIKDSAGNIAYGMNFVSITDGVITWDFTFPTDCTSGTYSVELTSTSADDGCDDCSLFTNLTLDCDEIIVNPDCTTPTIDQCNGGQISLIANQATALTLSGCDCDGYTVLWSSTDAEISFSNPNSASTNVKASATGSYQISATCSPGV